MSEFKLGVAILTKLRKDYKDIYKKIIEEILIEVEGDELLWMNLKII